MKKKHTEVTAQNQALLTFKKTKSSTEQTLLQASKTGNRSWCVLYRDSTQHSLPVSLKALTQVADIHGLKKHCITLSDESPERTLTADCPIHQIICIDAPELKDSLISLLSADDYPQKLILSAQNQGLGISTLKSLAKYLSQFNDVSLSFGANYAGGGDEGHLRVFSDEAAFDKHSERLLSLIGKLNNEASGTLSNQTSPLYLLAKQIHADLKVVPFKRELFHMFRHAAMGKRVDKSPYGSRLRAQCSASIYPNSHVVGCIDMFMRGQKNAMTDFAWAVNLSSISDAEWDIMESDLFRGVNHRMCVPSKEAWANKGDFSTPFCIEKNAGQTRFIHANCQVTINNRLGLMAMRICDEVLIDAATSKLRKAFLMP